MKADSLHQVDSLSSDPKWTYSPSHKAVHSMVIWWNIPNPHYYIFSWHTLWITVWATTRSMSIVPILRDFQEGRGFFHHIFPELSSVAPTRCSVIIYWMRSCHRILEEQWSTQLTIIHGEWQASAFWRQRGHWDKCSFSFGLPSLSKSPNTIISEPFKQDQWGILPLVIKSSPRKH